MSNPQIFQNAKSGSIKATGTYDIVDELGNVIRTVVDPKFCGCGLSQDKPLCDKSHANYVSNVTRMLEGARKTVTSVSPIGIWALRANEIRKMALEHRIADGEKLVGVKFGGALDKSKLPEKSYEGIFGYLTDAMEVKSNLDLKSLIYPLAEAEVVFKLGQELNQEIALEEVKDYVSHIAPGIEVFDCRYGAIDPFIHDAIADNACSGAYAIGQWVDAKNFNFEGGEISIYEGGALNQRVPASKIAGNPWQAVVNVSKKLHEAGVTLPKDAIIFSGSATDGIPMKAAEYKVEITGLGEVSFKAN